MLTGHGDIPMAVTALKAGALDFVSKPFDPAILLDSVREALAHVRARCRRVTNAEDAASRLQTLTPREAAVLGFLIEGDMNKVVACKLGISIRTVEHHRARIMQKMRVRTPVQLAKAVLAPGVPAG